MKAIVLAAGRGKRIQPLSDLLPKPLLPIGGEPMLATSLVALARSDVREVVIVVEHKAEMIEAFVGDGRRFGVRASFVRQGEPRGTGHAVAQATDFIDDDVVVLAGDTAFADVHIRGVIDLFRESGAGAALCLKRLRPDRLAQSSSVAILPDGTVTQFVEKPPVGTAPSDLAAALLHVYKRDMRECLAELAPSPRGEIELPDVLDLMRRRDHRIVGREFPAPPDLTDAEDFLRLNFAYIGPLLDSNRPIK